MSAPSEESVPLRPTEADDRPADTGKPASPAPPLDTMVLHETPGHLLRRAQQRAVDLYVRAVGEGGLRAPQFAVLLTVYQNPGLNQTDLVRRTGIDRSTIGDLIGRLVKRDLLRRKRTRSDQRSNTLWITDEGVAALNRNVEPGIAIQAEIMAPVPPERREDFIELLKLIADLPPETPNRADDQDT